jgi:REP element-mobilizing transposase RayT
MRIQFEGARYHVINRGNYRSDLFTATDSSEAFLRILHEAAERYGWRIHAYVLMRNHYHLALETPRPNLSEGMHWLQSTFATRFNRLHKQNGHLFQGRYKSILLEDLNALCRVVDYIHLNPVRAGIVAPAHVAQYTWSSLAAFEKKKRQAGMCAQDWLRGRGGWVDNKKGMDAYVEYLCALGNDEEAQKKAGVKGLSRGWAIGTAGWKQALARELSRKTYVEALPKEERREIMQEHWEEQLRQITERHPPS